MRSSYLTKAVPLGKNVGVEIPKELADAIGLKPGQEASWFLLDGVAQLSVDPSVLAIPVMTNPSDRFVMQQPQLVVRPPAPMPTMNRDPEWHEAGGTVVVDG